MSITTTETVTVDAQAYLKDLQKLVVHLEDDLRTRSQELPEVHERLNREYNQAKSQERTLETFESWRDHYLTQVAVGWVLTSVFLRYLEDNQLIDEVWLAGPGERMSQAHHRHELFFQNHPTFTNREYFEEAFRTVAKLPGCGELFGAERNPLWLLGPSGDAAKELLAFWQAIDPTSGELLRTFGDPTSGSIAATRFLGDLYQDLSEAAQKRYALLQTPNFVEEFILDRTLEPAIETFGLEEVRMLDPTCGSGHFLLGGFERLLTHWHQTAPSMNERDRVQKSLDGVYGVDLNPFAVAIARLRLLVAALRASGISRLKHSPNFKIHVATGDSLLHGRRFDRKDQGLLSTDRDWLPEAFAQGDFEEATSILSQHYHAVVGNPPYIADKDRAHKAEVRARYSTCHGKFVLAVPFTEVFFELATTAPRAGYVGMITANNFMKREFGTKLISEFFPSVDLTHVIDTSGAYLPGHGTPTVLLFGRHQSPSSPLVRAGLGIRGEPSTPSDPSRGLVWNSITALIDSVGAENDYLTVANLERSKLREHPWSLAGGGASELKELVESQCSDRLGSIAASIGITSVTGEDDLYVFPDEAACRRLGIQNTIDLVTGDLVRDWFVASPPKAIWTYDDDLNVVDFAALAGSGRVLWPFRTGLSLRRRFGTPMLEKGAVWYEWQELYASKLKTPLSITFAEVATHNHFVLDRGGKVFKQTAPVIKLPEGATEDEHLALLGLLNSSVWEFWAQQVFHNKGGPGGGSSKDEKWHDFYQRDGTKVARSPLPKDLDWLVPLAKKLDALALASAKLEGGLAEAKSISPGEVARAEAARLRLFQQRVALQEELDWKAYSLFSLVSADLLWPGSLDQLPAISPGERAFEVEMARQVESGDLTTRWWEREERVFRTDLPAHWPEDYKRLVTKRIESIKADRLLRLVESFNCKRRWELEPWSVVRSRALEGWLLKHTEAAAETSSALTTTAQLADKLRGDADFLQVAELYTGRDDFDLTKLVTDLVMSQDVPYLPILRYKPSGLRKRAQWEKTWELQRREDAGEDVGKIPVPPKYGSGDFLKSHYWSLRGKLDVPKERFISYPLAEREADPSPVIGWAGWNHLEQAKALASYYLERREQDGWSVERLTPLLAGLLELIPWLKQWHNDIDPEMDVRMGDFYEGFLTDQARGLGLTLQDLRDWRPPAKKGRKKK